MKCLGLALVMLAGCSSGEASPLALDEPLRVVGGTFKEGALPGSAPLQEQVDGGTGTPGAHVTLLESNNNIVRPGQGGKSVKGRATGNTMGVGVRFPDLGTGYWVVPSDVPDPAAPGELTWAMSIDFARDLPAGIRPLRFAAIDASGDAAEQSELTVCVTSPIPDNLNACDPTIAPPAVVVSLAWDSDVDLDLVLIAPDGKVVDAKHPTTAPILDGGIAPEPSDGALDRDSNAGCALDNVRRENVVFQQKPAPGQYLVHANLFSACGQAATRFTATVWLAEPTGKDGQQRLVQALGASGELLAIDANGGASTGMFVTEFFIR